MTDPPRAVDQQPPKKRKRVPVACGPCRGKKSKCDGRRPVCSACEVQHLDCIYANASLPSTATVPASYLEQLEKRLLTLEHEVSALKGHALSPHTTVDSDDSHGIDRARVVLHPAGAPSVSVVAATADNVDISGDSPPNGVSPDATDGVATIEFDDRSDSMYFGPSSNIAFTRLIQRCLAKALRSAGSRNRTNNNHSSNSHNSNNREALSTAARPPHADEAALQRRALGLSRPPSPLTRPVPDPWLSSPDQNDAYTVPPKEERLRLVRRFFSDTGVLFPYVSETHFWRMYTAAESSRFRPGHVRRSCLALFNMILAMAISTDPDPRHGLATRSALSSVYFGRASALCLDQMLTGASVEMVQVLLLMTQYLQGTRRSLQTWTIHGIAVKAAFQLGLHVSDTGLPRSITDPIEQEMRRRTWQGCLGLDRSLSMTFGRPPSILLPGSSCPSARHELVSSSENPNPRLVWSAEETSTDFWNATTSLTHVLYDVLTTLYGSNAGVSSPSKRDDHHPPSLADRATAVLHIDQQLIAWQASLPSSLVPLTAADLSREAAITLPKKLAVTLTLRYHNLRLLAHRPILDVSLEHVYGVAALSPAEAALLQQVGHQSRDLSLQSAEAILTLVHSVALSADVRRGFLGAWWFTLYYTLNAALTIVALLIYSAAEALPGQTPPEWQREVALLKDAITCISHIDSDNSLAAKCAELVTTLRNYVQSGLAIGGTDCHAPETPSWSVDGQHGQDRFMRHLMQNVGGDVPVELTEFLPDLEFDPRMYNFYDFPTDNGGRFW